MPAVIAFTQEGFKQRIQQGTDVNVSLAGVSGKVSTIATTVQSVLKGNWGTAQTTALHEIDRAIQKMRDVVAARNAMLSDYSVATWGTDASNASAVQTQGAQTGGVISQALAGR